MPYPCMPDGQTVGWGLEPRVAMWLEWGRDGAWDDLAIWPSNVAEAGRGW